MRILFISQYFYPENFANNKIVADLVKRGNEVTVVCAIPNYPGGRFYDGYGITKRKRESYQGADVHRVSVIPRGNNSVQLVLNYLSFVITAGWKCLWMKRKDFDVVLCSAPSPVTIAIPGIVASRRMKAPVHLWLQDLWPHTVFDLLKVESRWLRTPIKVLCRWIYRNLDFIHVPSLAFVSELADYAPDTSQYRFLPNTIEAIHQPVKADIDLRKQSAIPDGDFTMVYAGNIGTAQNVDVLIDSARILKGRNFTFVMLGDGRDRSRMETRIAELGIGRHFRFLGSVPNDEVVSHLGYADAAVLTLADEPAFSPIVPYRLQSFLGCGKLILASANGEVARIVDEAECGFVASANDAPGFAANIEKAMALSSGNKQLMDQNARTYALAHYQQKKVMDDLEQCLRSSVDHR